MDQFWWNKCFGPTESKLKPEQQRRPEKNVTIQKKKFDMFECGYSPPPPLNRHEPLHQFVAAITTNQNWAYTFFRYIFIVIVECTKCQPEKKQHRQNHRKKRNPCNRKNLQTRDLLRKLESWPNVILQKRVVWRSTVIIISVLMSFVAHSPAEPESWLGWFFYFPKWDSRMRRKRTITLAWRVYNEHCHYLTHSAWSRGDIH